MQARCQRARGEDRGFVEQGDALVLLLLVASEPSPMRHEGVAQFAPQRVDVRPLALEVAHALVGQLALGFGGGAVGHRRLSSSCPAASWPAPSVHRRCRSGSSTGARRPHGHGHARDCVGRSEEHTSELQSLMRISYAVFCLKKKKNIIISINLNYTSYINTYKNKKTVRSSR